MSGKYALIIGNTEYIDSGLAQLSAPGKDAEDFAHVLKDQEIGAFDSVNILLNQSSAAVTEAIDEFFDQKKQDDLLVLYFSGHGVRDELGNLYLAVKNTIRSRLRSTAVKSDFIREAMDQSRSKRQVLILDCCNSGAFAQGTKAATGGSIGTATAFESGFGRIILTASDSTQFAWEGDKVIGETDNSLFTHYLVEGLKGDADNDGDGRITVDELYDYTYEKVRRATPKQTPSKFSTKQQGEIVLRQSTRIEDIKPVPLPDDLISAAKSSLSYIREAAVKQLDELLKGKNLGLARSAKEALEHIAENDDSKTISRAAFQALEAIRQAEQVALQKAEEERLAKLEAERIAEEERRVREQAEAERKTKAEAERLAAAQKAEEERITKAKLETERLAEEKRLADQAEKERQAKAEAKRLADEKAEAERLAAQKTENERLAKAKLDAERLAEEKRLADEAEKERQARTEAKRLADEKAEAERLATQKEDEKRIVEAKLETDRLAEEKQPTNQKADRILPLNSEPNEKNTTKTLQVRTKENYRISKQKILVFTGVFTTLFLILGIIIWKGLNREQSVQFVLPDENPIILPALSDSPSVIQLSFSPDNKSLFSVSSDGVHLWDIKEGVLIKEIFDKPASIVNNQFLVRTTGSQIELINIDGVSQSKKIQAVGDVLKLSFSPDGKMVFITTPDAIYVLDTETEKTLHTFDHSIYSDKYSYFSPKGNYLILDGYPNIEIWRTTDWVLIHEFDKENLGLLGIAFSNNEKMLVGTDATVGIYGWDTINFQQLFASTYSSTPEVYQNLYFIFSPDDIFFASSKSGSINLWDSANGNFLNTFKSHSGSFATSLVFSSDGTYLAAGYIDGVIRLWDVTR